LAPTEEEEDNKIEKYPYDEARKYFFRKLHLIEALIETQDRISKNDKEKIGDDVEKKCSHIIFG
jgi:hypothetical protein